MVPAGIRLDLADGTLCLPNEVRIQLSGRRTVYDNRVADVKLEQYARILAGGLWRYPLKVDLRSTEDMGHKRRAIGYDYGPGKRTSTIAEGDQR